MIYGSIRVHTGPYGPIFVARGEKSQVEKVKINISDRDFFLGLFQGDVLICFMFVSAFPNLTSYHQFTSLYYTTVQN